MTVLPRCIRPACVLAVSAGLAVPGTLFWPATDARAGQEANEAAAAAPAPLARWRIELKRQNTGRGSPDESTRTTLRLESLHDGPVRLVRVDLPFPDAPSDEPSGFSGDPFNPRLGDLKLRLGFRPWRSGPYSFPSFLELTLPTADPSTLGSGKYQLSAALRLLAPLSLPVADTSAHASRFEAELQQVTAFAGDPACKDIGYTKLELSLYDLWRETWSWELKFKPSIDWVLDGQTGAVGEIEVGVSFAEQWRSTLMLGHRLWGPDGVSGTYDKRVELTLSRSF